MFTELQFVAVGAFLLWGLASALCDAFLPHDGVRTDRECTEGRRSEDSTTLSGRSVKN
ncbi:Uncharacterised protein [Mycolicibacterium aurum]|uniref:Uncharacterized protein n=1 Tax=Mycolicibacterium aurum TaxID=1791 RepID=A0A3S4VW45_MYCAU|nr:hypothetical protein [Mycolicibacterium aurum]VEG56787.1 Uncharacterised protein [Mycolicibacterium aurum]